MVRLVALLKALDDDCALLAVDIHLAKRQHFGEPPATINKSLAEGAFPWRQVPGGGQEPFKLRPAEVFPASLAIEKRHF